MPPAPGRERRKTWPPGDRGVDSRTRTDDTRTWADDTRAQLDDTRTRTDDTRAQLDDTRTWMDDTRTWADDTRTQLDDTRSWRAGCGLRRDSEVSTLDSCGLLAEGRHRGEAGRGGGAERAVATREPKLRRDGAGRRAAAPHPDQRPALAEVAVAVLQA
jgi:hypothetical protein